MFPDYSYAQALFDLIIGVVIGCALMTLLQVNHLNPLEVEVSRDYDRAFGDGPVTLVPPASPWVTWGGGPMPMDFSAQVRVRFRGGLTSIGVHDAGCWNWHHNGDGSDIVAYQVFA